MQAKQSSLPKEAIRLDQIVADVKHSLENMDDFHRIEIKYDFGHAQEIYSVKSFIFSIFHNLIANSIKYSRPDIAPVLEIRSRHTKNGYEIIFSDNGTGIDMAVNGSKLFGLYNRFDTSKEGSGIGLYIVKTQVEALHGQIEVSSEVNVGTTFKINIKQ
jgi:signal transduction histidine kinase